MFKKTTVFATALLVVGLLWAGVNRLTAARAILPQDDLETAFHAYLNSEFDVAIRISGQHLNDPKGRLLHSLCLLYDKNRQDINRGLAGLKELLDDERIVPVVRAEAALAYARTIHVFHVRGTHRAYEAADIESLYETVIELSRNDFRGPLAAAYLAQYFIDTDDAEGAEKAIRFLEAFIGSYGGPRVDLVPAHLCLETIYVQFKDDYGGSYRHLQQAYEAGIAGTLLRRDVLFRLGRISHEKFGDYAAARRYYEDYIHTYPEASKVPLVQLYLDKLTAAGF